MPRFAMSLFGLTNLAIAICMVLGLVALLDVQGAFRPRDRDQCLQEVARTAKSENATRLGAAQCAKRFPPMQSDCESASTKWQVDVILETADVGLPPGDQLLIACMREYPWVFNWRTEIINKRRAAKIFPEQ